MVSVFMFVQLHREVLKLHVIECTSYKTKAMTTLY